MSKAKEKAEQIKMQGALERGEFNPKPDAAHLKMYKYWERVTQPDRRQENFCHYWRVVLIWGPLVWLLMHLLDGLVKVFSFLPSVHLSDKAHKRISTGFKWAAFGLVGLVVVYLIGVLIYGFFTDPWLTLGVLGAILGIAAGLVGIIAVVTFFVARADAKKELDQIARDRAYFDGEISREEWLGKKSKKAPGRVRKFFSGVKDFLILIGRAIQVRKWKICPLVQIPDEVDTAQRV